MNWRWYLPGLIIVLAFFGMGMEQVAVPNQEIVIQFNADSISSNVAQHAVSEITDQLKTIGVSDVQISEIRDGKLKVTYFSTVDIGVIKNLFYKQNKFQLGHTAFNEKNGSSKVPFRNNSNTYKLDVVKIQKNFDSNLGLHGLPLEVKSAKDQYLNSIVSLGSGEINFAPRHNIERLVSEDYYDTVLLINNISHKIPEVRAGPLT